MLSEPVAENRRGAGQQDVVHEGIAASLFDCHSLVSCTAIYGSIRKWLNQCVIQTSYLRLSHPQCAFSLQVCHGVMGGHWVARNCCPLHTHAEGDKLGSILHVAYYYAGTLLGGVKNCSYTRGARGEDPGRYGGPPLRPAECSPDQRTVVKNHRLGYGTGTTRPVTASYPSTGGFSWCFSSLYISTSPTTGGQESSGAIRDLDTWSRTTALSSYVRHEKTMPPPAVYIAHVPRPTQTPLPERSPGNISPIQNAKVLATVRDLRKIYQSKEDRLGGGFEAKWALHLAQFFTACRGSEHRCVKWKFCSILG